MVDPEITEEASSCAEIWAAACAAAITGRKSVAVLVAVAVAETEGLAEPEYDPDAVTDIDAEGVLVCFGERLPDDEDDIDTVRRLDAVTLVEAVTELLTDSDPEGLVVTDPDDDVVDVCVGLVELLGEELGDADELVEPDELTDGELLAEPLGDPDGVILTDDVCVTVNEEDCVGLFVTVEETVLLTDGELLRESLEEDELDGELDDDTLIVTVGVRDGDTDEDTDPLDELELVWLSVGECVTDEENVVDGDTLWETDTVCVEESMADTVAEYEL